MATTRDFSRFYFDDVLAALDKVLRADLPAHTETSPLDPLNAMKRLYAYIAHGFGAKLDLVAAELSTATAQRRSSWISLGRGVGYALASDSPALVDVLADLTDTPGGAAIIIPARAIFSTAGDSENAAAVFEAPDVDVTTGGSDLTLISRVAGVYSAPVTGAPIANPFGAVPAVGDTLYVGHPVLLPTSHDLAFTDGGGGIADFSTVTEYFDGGNRRVAPGSVAVAGADLIFEISDFAVVALSPGNLVSVRCLATGVEATALTYYGAGDAKVLIAGYLGQAVPSTNAADYEVFADWVAVGLAGLAWGTATSPETFAYTLPHDDAHRWSESDVDGTAGYWVRHRVWNVQAAPAGPATAEATITAGSTTSVMVSCVQGRTVVDVLGTAAGTASERFALAFVPFVQGSISSLDVGGDTDWSIVMTLYDSDADDKHAMVVEAPDGTIYLVFGDGTNGVIPSGGASITLTYRVQADVDGNVTAGAITRAEATLRSLGNVRNDRAATGWRRREGADEAGIEALRLRVPGSVRARTRAVTADDCEWLAVGSPLAGGFATADGRSPFARAVAVEQGAGFKTVRLILVGTGGAVPSAADVAELDLYFNGRVSGVQRFGGIAPANQQLYAVPYTPSTLNIAVTITVLKRHAQRAAAAVEAAIRAGVQPLALTPDGSYRWTPGQSINERALTLLVGEAGLPLLDLSFTAPALPVALGAAGLPVLGTVAVAVVEV